MTPPAVVGSILLEMIMWLNKQETY